MGARSYALAVAIAALMVVSVGAAHAQTAPFTAETKSLTTTEVTFRTQIPTGVIDLDDWAVTDSGHPEDSQSLDITKITPYNAGGTLQNLFATMENTLRAGGLDSGNAQPFSKLLIEHAELSSTSAKPSVKFTAGDFDIFDSGTDGATSPVPTHTATATDGVAPAISSAAFDGANAITVTLSEHMKGTAAAIEGYTYTVMANNAAVTLATEDTDADPTLPVDYAEQATTSTLRIELAADAAEGVAHTVTLPTELLDEGDNAFADSTEDATLQGVAFEAETKSTTTTEVTFDGGSLAGTLDVENWDVTDNDGDGADVDLDVTSVVALDGDGNAVAATEATDGDTKTVAATAGYTKLLLTHDALSSTGDTPRVAYSGGDLDEGSSAVAGRPAEATDGIAPSFTAAITSFARGSVTEVTVTFTEPVSKAADKALPLAGDWTVSAARDATPTLVEYDLGADPATATLTLSQNARITRGGSLDVTLDVPAARQGSIVDAAGRAVADPTTYTIPDRTAPEMYAADLTSGTEVSVTLNENVSITFVASDWELDGSTFTGATTNVNEIILEIDPPRSTGLPDNAMLAYRGSGSVTDVAGNELATGASVAVTDAAAPVISSAEFDGAGAILVTLSEHLEGTAAEIEGRTYSVTAGGEAVALAAADADANPALPVDYAEQAGTSTLRIALAAGAAANLAHTVTLPAGLEDEEDNALAGRTADATRTGAFEAETRSLTTTVISFGGDYVTDSVGESDWSLTDNDGGADVALDVTRLDPLDSEGNRITRAASVDGSRFFAPTTTNSEPEVKALLLTHEALSSPGDTPRVTYAGVGMGFMGDDMKAGGTVVPNDSVEASDGIAPVIASAAFDGTSAIVVTLSEHMKGTEATIEGLAYSVTAGGSTVGLAAVDANADPALPVDYAEQATTSTIRVTLAAAAQAGVAHTVTLPAGLRDAGDNAFADGTVDATHGRLFEAETRSTTTTVVTFSGFLEGIADYREWSVTDNDGDGTDRTLGVSRISILNSAGNIQYPIESYQGFARGFPLEGATYRAFIITHDALDSTGDTPSVTYSSGNLQAGAAAIPDGESVEAADGIAPSISSAAFDGPGAILVTLSEHMKGTEATIEGLTYSVTAGGSPVTLAAADANADPSVPVDYAEQAGTSTIRLTLASGALPDVAHTVTLPTALLDAADNAFTDRTADATRTGAFTATTQTATTTVVSFGDQYIGGSFNVAHWSLTDNDGGSTDVEITPGRADLLDADGNTVGGVFSQRLANGNPDTGSLVPANTYKGILLTHGEISPDDTPRVTYSGAGMAFNGAVLTAGGTAVPNDFAEAADGIAPAFTVAVTPDSRFFSRVAVTFSEPVYLADGKGLPADMDWLLTRTPAFTNDEGTEVPATTVRTGILPEWSPGTPTATVGATSMSFTLPFPPIAVAFSPQAAADRGSLVDGGDNALAAGAEASTGPDGTNPTFTARFATERTIVLEASEELARHTVTDSSFTVSGVGLAAANPVTIAPGSTGVTLSLGGDAVPGTEYTITPAATITDTNVPPNAYAAGAIRLTYSPPAVTAVSYSVLDGDGDAREAPYASHARAGDTIRLSITLAVAADPNSPPTVLFVGKTADADRVTMTAGAGDNEWTASYTVETVEQNAGLADGPFTFAAAVTGASGTGRTVTQETVASATPPAIDRTPPTFTAETTTTRDIAVTFSEPVSGTSLATDWTVGGNGAAVSPLVMTADTVVELRAAKFGSGDTPEVSYTMPTRQGAVPLLDAAGNAVATQSATPSDGVPPAVASYRFTSDTVLRVTFEENLDSSDIIHRNVPHLYPGPEGLTDALQVSRQTIAGDAASACTSCAYVLTYGHDEFPLVAGTHYLELTGIADTQGNRLGYDPDDDTQLVGLVRLPVTYNPAAPTDPPTVSSAETASATLTVVTLSEDVTGATAAADWAVAGTVVRGVASGEASSVAPDADADDRNTQVTVTSADKITLLHDAISTGATPSVAYSHTTSGRLAGAQGNVGAGSVTATDGAAPAFAAVTATPTTMTITFTEPVTGTTSRSDWGVGGAVPASISETAPDADTTLTLTYPARGTGAAPAVSYGGLSLADAAGNPVAATSSPHVASSDGVAPSFTAEATNIGRGSILGVTVTFTEPVSQAAGKTLPEEGDWTVFSNREATPSLVEYDLEANPATATLTLASRDRLDGAISLGVSLDVEAAGEADRQGSIVDAAGNAVADGTTYEEADRTVPVMYYATLISGTEVSVTLTEDVSVAFAASDWELDGSTFTGATTNVHEIILEISPPRSTGLPDNAMLTYRGTGSVTDGAGNALATGTSVAVTDGAAPTAVSAMSIDSDTVSVVFSEAIGTAPASALTLRNAAGAGAGDIVARATGTPVIGTPGDEGAIANSQVTFDFVPVAVAPDTEAPATLMEGMYWFHGTKGIRDASDGERRHNPRGSDAGVPISTSVAPTFTAWFIDPRTIELQPSENLARDTVIAAGSITVKAPDNTNRPADADNLPDTIALAGVSPVTYTIGSVITVNLLNPAPPGVTYTIEPSTTITDADDVPYGGEGVPVSYRVPFTAEAISRTQTVVTFRDGALSGTLTAFVWRVVEGDPAQPVNHRRVSSVAPLDASGSAVPGATSTLTIDENGLVSETPATLAAADGYTQIVITHDPLGSTDATPEVTYQGGNLLSGTTRVVGLVPVTGTDGISPEVVSYRLPGPDDGAGLGAHLIVVFSEDMDLPATHHVLPHLYAAPTGGNYISDIIGTSFQTLNGHSCNTCVMTVEYNAEPAEGTYYMAITSATDLQGNAYDKDASRQVGEEGRIRIEYDRTAPVLGQSSFTSTTTISIAFDDTLSTTPALTAANFPVTVPDDTNDPPDADSNPDAVALDADTPVTYDVVSRTVTLHLAENAVQDVVHTVTPTSITNVASIAYAGGSATATYAPLFAAQALDGQTMRITFVGDVGTPDVGATVNAADWSVTDHNAPTPTDRAVAGIFGVYGTPEASRDLYSERELDIRHAAIGPGNSRLAIEYTVPVGGLTVGGVALLPGSVWAADATYALPFEAEARSLTETVVTFDGGALSGPLSALTWRVVEGDAAQTADHRPVTSVAALDASGSPVPGATATFTVADDRRVTDMPVTLEAASGYTQLLLTHEPLESTAATPVVTHHASGGLLENGLRIFPVSVTASDRIPPAVEEYRRGAAGDTVGFAAPHLVLVFSEDMDFPIYRFEPDLYSAPTGDNRVRDTTEVSLSSGGSDCISCILALQYNAALPDGIYYAAASTLVDMAGNAVDPASPTAIGEESRIRIVLDSTAPILQSAEFTGAYNIAVRFDDGLDNTPPLSEYDFAVTAPDDTLRPADPDTNPDTIGFAAGAQVSYDLDTLAATLYLREAATPGATYTVTPATTVTNESGIAFGGGSTTATYTPVFSAESIDGNTVRVTFTGDVTATLTSAEWIVVDNNAPGPSSVSIMGISAVGGEPAVTHALSAARTFDITHPALRPGPVPPTVLYVVPDGGVTVGSKALAPGRTWTAEATLAAPFAAETRALTETVLTFDGGTLTGSLVTLDWSVTEGDSALAITSIAPLDSSGDPVADKTATPASGGTPVSLLQDEVGYEKLLITHAPLSSTAAVSTVTHVLSNLREGGLYVFEDVPVEADDRTPPEVVSIRRGHQGDSFNCDPEPMCDRPTVYGFRGQLPPYFTIDPSIVIHFSEELVHYNGRGTDAHIYRGDAGTERVTTARYSNLGPYEKDCERCGWGMQYNTFLSDGVYYAALSTLTDRAGNAPDLGPYSQHGRLRVVLDGSAPVLQSAEFTGAYNIEVKFDDGLDHMPPLTENNFAVTAPDDTLLPADPDTNPDVIGFAASAQVSYDLPSRTATLYLREAATPGVTYTVTPSSITNEAGIAFGGGSTTAVYTPPFTAETIDGDTTRVTFTGDVTATLSSGQWAVTDNNAPGPSSTSITGISAEGGAPAVTHALSAARTFDITQAALRVGPEPPTIYYVVPDAGLTVGDTALVPGRTWAVDATFAAPYEADARSRTETVLTFDGGDLSGSLITNSWQILEGTETRAIASIAPLDSSGDPVAEKTAVPTAPDFAGVPVSVLAEDEYTKLLITHEPVDSTAAEFTVTQTFGGLSEGGLYVFEDVPVEADDSIPPELVSIRRGHQGDSFNCDPEPMCDRPTVYGYRGQLPPYFTIDPSIVIHFSEELVHYNGRGTDAHIYRGDAGTERVTTARYSNLGPYEKDCERCGWGMQYNSFLSNGVYYASLSTLTDRAGNAPDLGPYSQHGRLRVVLDGTAPVLQSAEFTGAKSLAVRFDDGLDDSPPLTASNFAVTTGAGAVALDAENPVSYDLFARTAMLRLAEAVEPGVTHTVTPSSITNEVGHAFAGGSTTASYEPLFTAEALDGDTTRVTFMEDVTATIAADSWAVTDNTGSTPTDRAVTGISAQGGTEPATTLALSAGRVIDITHAALGPGREAPTITYTVPVGGITIGTTALVAGAVWVTEATLADPFTAETRSKTETVITFDAGSIHGSLATSSWRIQDGTTVIPIESIAPLDPSGSPVAADTAVPYSGFGPIETVAVAASDGYTQLLFTHSALSSTGSTPTIEHTSGPDLTENSLHIFPRVPVTSADRAPPELESVRHANDREFYPYSRPHVVFNFSEDMALQGAIYPHLYRAETGGTPTHSMVSAHYDAAGRDCNTCSVVVGYSARVDDGSYYAALGSLADLSGNRVDASSSLEQGMVSRVSIVLDPTAPIINVAEFSGTQTIRLDFDDALDVTPALSPANFAVTAPDGTNLPDDANADPDTIALDATTPVTYDAATTSVTLRLASGAKADTPYTITPSSIRNEAGLPYARGAEQAIYTPLFSTLLLSQTATQVTFSAPVSGTFATGDWEVKDTDAAMTLRAVTGVSDGDDAASAMYTLRNTQELVLDHASLATGESMPAVTYTVPDDSAVTVGALPLAAGGVWTTTAHTAESSPSLTAPSVTFTTPTLIAARFGEPVELLDVGAFRVNGANHRVETGSAHEIHIRLPTPAQEGVPHTVEIDREAVRGIAPPNLELARDTVVPGVTYYDPSTFLASTERVGSDTYVKIAFNGRAMGTTSPAEWPITHAPQFDPVPMQQLFTLCGGTMTATASLDVSDVCGDGTPSEFYIPNPHVRSSGEIAFVKYVPRSDQTTVAITVNGQAVGDMFVRATDGTPTLISSATTLDENRVLVRFDEQVRGTPDASQWYHYASVATSDVPPTAAELAAATTAFDSAVLIEEGLAMILTAPDSHAPASGWGSSDTAAVPGAIGLRVPAGADAGITDMAGNAMASGTARGPVADGAPPGLASLTARVLEDHDDDDTTEQVAKTGDFAHVAHAGDAIEVSARFTEAGSTTTSTTVQVFGTVLSTSLSDDRMGTTGRIPVPAHWATDGLLEYSVSVADARGNAAGYSRQDAPIPDNPLRTDVSAPELTRIFPISPMRLSLAFSEEVTGTGMVTAAAGETVAESDPSAPLVFPNGIAQGSQATADFSLTQGMYTFHFADTLTDLGGRTIPPVEIFVPGPPPPTEELMTDRYIPAPPPPPDRMEERPFDRMIVAPPPPPELPREAPPPPFRLLADALVDDDPMTDELESRPFGSTLQIGYERTGLTIPEGTVIRHLGEVDPGESPGTILMELARQAADTTYRGMQDASEDEREANERAAQSLRERTPEILVTFGKRNDMQPVLFDQPVRITLFGAAGAEHVFYTTSTRPNPDAPPSREVSTIPRCEDTGYGSSLEDPPEFPTPTPPMMAGEGDNRRVVQPAQGLLECYLLLGQHIVIWTNHFTQFGAADISRGGSGGDGCDDCTPPTLGVDSTGTRRVSGGFTYNGDTVNAEYYYTPLPLITVETGEENVAAIKVFEDSGTHNLRHVGLSFGLSNGQHFSEAEAAIRVDIAFNGEHTVSLDDPQNAIDADSLSAEVSTTKCMAGSETECRLVTIRHTFREPLEFNVVSTIVWDDRRNSWQNFFNHGVHVTGESLNPSHGIEVNGGELVLYPLIASHADEDGDGIFDYDTRHVTYMLDAEYRVYRLTPDGTYQPLRNLATLHHEVDESMWDESLPKKYGPSRASDLFAELVAEERRIAEEVLAAMDIPTEGNATAVVAHSYDEAAAEQRAERLRIAIADEINDAELSMQRLYPEMYVVE